MISDSYPILEIYLIKFWFSFIQKLVPLYFLYKNWIPLIFFFPSGSPFPPQVAIKVMGGPSIVTHFGRLDAQGLSEGAPSAQGRLPDADKDPWFGRPPNLKGPFGSSPKGKKHRVKDDVDDIDDIDEWNISHWWDEMGYIYIYTYDYIYIYMDHGLWTTY